MLVLITLFCRVHAGFVSSRRGFLDVFALAESKICAVFPL